MALIKVSEVVKKELEQLKKDGEFKSLDAVIRYDIDSSVEVVGGIFLNSTELIGYEELGRGKISIGGEVNIRNVRNVSVRYNYVNTHISPPQTIKLYKCLKCGTLGTQNDNELIIVPNCLGCGKGMTPITIQIGFPRSDKLENIKLWARENAGEYLDNQNWSELGEILDMNLDWMNMEIEDDE